MTRFPTVPGSLIRARSFSTGAAIFMLLDPLGDVFNEPAWIAHCGEIGETWGQSQLDLIEILHDEGNR